MVGCNVEVVRDKFPVVVVGLGEAGLTTNLVAEIGLGRSLNSFIGESTFSDENNLKTFVHSGVGGLHGKTGRKGSDVDFPTLVRDQIPKPVEGYNLVVVEGTACGKNRLGLEGKGVIFSDVVAIEEIESLDPGTSERIQLPNGMDTIGLSKVE